MKANEAPEKVYMSPAGVLYKGDRQQCDDIEYTRTDVFIEKAADYIKRYSALLDSDGNDCMPKWIEEFKKAMKL